MKVVVITMSGFRPDFLGCYGNQWIDTPTFDRLAAEGVVFDQHYADRPDAAGARQAWRTGRYWLASAVDEAPPPATEELLAILRSQGIATHLTSGNQQVLDSRFASGWDDLRPLPCRGDDAPHDRIGEAAVACLGELECVPRWLLWIDLPSLAPPWHNVPAEFFESAPQQQLVEDEEEATGEDASLEPLIDPVIGSVDPDDDETLLRLQRTYAGVARSVDVALGRLFENLADPLLDEVIWIITSDHGLPLGEHSVVGAVRPWLHDELIHVPLLLRLPGRQEAGLRIPALTQAVDLMPTLLDWFGLPIPPSVQGRSLLPLLRGEVEHLRPYACSGLRIGDAVEWALRTPEWAFLLPLHDLSDGPPRGRQLYVKPDDRWEVNNLIQHHLALAERLEQTLRGFVQATHRPGSLQAPELSDPAADWAATETTGGNR